MIQVERGTTRRYTVDPERFGWTGLRLEDLRGGDPNDIWVADRLSIDEPWQEPRRLEEPINAAGFADFCPTPVRGRSSSVAR